MTAQFEESGQTAAALEPILEIIPETSDPKPRHRKIAKLPKQLRDLVNSLLEDGAPAREIIAKLQASTDPPLPYPIPEVKISDWRATGFLRYLAQQERLAQVQANHEGADGLSAPRHRRARWLIPCLLTR